MIAREIHQTAARGAAEGLGSVLISLTGALLI